MHTDGDRCEAIRNGYSDNCVSSTITYTLFTHTHDTFLQHIHAHIRNIKYCLGSNYAGFTGVYIKWIGILSVGK